MSHVTIKLMRCSGMGAQVPGITSAPYHVGVPVGVPVGTPEVKVSSGTSQVSTLAPTAAMLTALRMPGVPQYLFWRIKNCGDFDATGVATDRNVAVNVLIDGSATPEATASPAAMTETLLPGDTVDLTCSAFSETVAVIEADIEEA